MFKMNPSAKEFIPAHILKKRQEEADRLGEQLDKVNLGSTGVKADEAKATEEKSSGDSNRVQDDSLKTPKSDEVNAKCVSSNRNSTSPTKNQQQKDHPTQEVQNNVQHTNNNNNHNDGDYPEELQDLIDEEDDRFLLNAGENLCEFNGEQFIIPGDDEYEPAVRAGYDFGNTEDNEDEDVCNAFEEFLENLPSQ